MKVLIVLVSVLACAVAQNVVCGKGTTNKEVTVEDKKTYNFKTQKGKKYPGNTKCTVNYKMGDSCAKMSFACTKFSVKNNDKKKCTKGDKLTVTANGKSKSYCKPKPKPKVSSTGDLSVVFTSDKKKSAAGAVCKVKCTEAKDSGTVSPSSTTTPSPTLPPTTTPSLCQCGLAKPKKRIVNGTEADINEYPWQVGIVEKGQTTVFCGGSLISDQWVLTAAHCLQYDNSGTVELLLGEHDYTTTTESKMVRASIEKIVNHPNYDKPTSNYDFSLIKLAEPVDFFTHPHIRPVCLPEPGSGDYAGVVATVTGWGATSLGGPVSETLQEVSVKVMSNTECTSMYSYHPLAWISDQMLCAMVDGGGQDACQGDSGGPLVTPGDGDGQNYELIGVVSWGDGCAGASSPGVYSRVAAQIAWITETTADSWNSCPRT